jgi:hypothetical protein
MSLLFLRSRTVFKFNHLSKNISTSYRRRRLPQLCNHYLSTIAHGSNGNSALAMNRTVQMQSMMKNYPDIVLSKYEIVELEEYIYQTVTNVVRENIIFVS